MILYVKRHPSSVITGIALLVFLLSFEPASAETKRTYRFELEHVNDNLPRQAAFLYPKEDLSYGIPDDDGWTAEFGLNVQVQQGAWSLLWQSRAQMVTQKRIRGEYRGLRQDILESALVLSRQYQLSDRLALDVGFGAGVQNVGEFGLYGFQRWVHETFPIGGRIIQLQRFYPDVSILAASATVGSALSYRLRGRWLRAYGDVMSTFSLQGLHRTRSALGLEATTLGFRSSLEVVLASVQTGEGVLEFIDTRGTFLGTRLRVEYLFKKRVGAFGAFSLGGVRSEPVYTLGLVVAAPKAKRQRIRGLF